MGMLMSRHRALRQKRRAPVAETPEPTAIQTPVFKAPVFNTPTLKTIVADKRMRSV